MTTPRTRSAAVTHAAAEALIQLHQAHPEWLYDREVAPPPSDALHLSADEVLAQHPTPPRLVSAANVHRWDSVTPGKRSAAHLVQWLIDRFGERSWGARELWSLMPYIRDFPGRRALPDRWTTHVDSVGRQYYHDNETGTSHWVRPRPDDAPGAAAAPPPEPIRRSARIAEQNARSA